jgi:hypothetical protein
MEDVTFRAVPEDPSERQEVLDAYYASMGSLSE